MTKARDIADRKLDGTDLSFGDNDKAIFGAGSDLQIYAGSGSSTIAETGAGNLRILADNIEINNAANSKNYIYGASGGALNLYYDGSKKIATTSTGIDVTGTATMDGLTVDGDTVISSGNKISSDSSAGNFSLVGGASYRGGQIDVYGGNTGDSNSGTLAFRAGLTGSSATQPLRMLLANNGDISFYEDTGTTAKFFWDASAESLGIGTSSPATTLAVNGNTSISNNGLIGAGMLGYSGLGVYDADSSDTSVDALYLRKGGGVNSTGSNAVSIAFGNASGNTYYVGQRIRGYRDGSNGNGGLIFETKNDSSISTTAERMRIDSSGNLLVGTTSASSSARTVIKSTGINSFLYAGNEFNFADNHATANGDLYLNYRELAGGGSINNYRFLKGDASHSYSTLQAAAFTVTSDYRTKENIVPLENASDRLKQLKPCRFNFIDGVGMEAGRTVDGFIAHEAQEVVPEAVEGVKDAMTTKSEIVTPAQYDEGGNLIAEAVYEDVEIPAYQGIDQSKLVPLLTAALQEALTRIETLEAKVAVLENN